MIPVPRLDVRARNYRGTLLLARGDVSLEMTEVAAFIWKHMDGVLSIDDIAALVAAEYEIAPDIAAADLAELVDSLAEAGMLDLKAP